MFVTCSTARASTALPSPLPFKSTGKKYASLLQASAILPRVSVARSYPCGGGFVDVVVFDDDSEQAGLPSVPVGEAEHPPGTAEVPPDSSPFRVFFEASSSPPTGS